MLSFLTGDWPERGVWDRFISETNVTTEMTNQTNVKTRQKNVDGSHNGWCDRHPRCFATSRRRSRRLLQRRRWETLQGSVIAAWTIWRPQQINSCKSIIFLQSDQGSLVIRDSNIFWLYIKSCKFIIAYFFRSIKADAIIFIVLV